MYGLTNLCRKEQSGRATGTIYHFYKLKNQVKVTFKKIEKAKVSRPFE